MSDARQAAVELAALKALKDEIDNRYHLARENAARVLDPHDRKVAALPDGREIGTVSYVRGKTTGKVTNPSALLRWVQANRPGEVVTVESVRESYIAALLTRCRDEDGAAVDPDTGEEIPGLCYVISAPHVVAKQTPEQKEAFVTAYMAGHLDDALGALLYVHRPLLIEGDAQ